MRRIIPCIMMTAVTACAPRGLAHVTLPTGASAPSADYATIFAGATKSCRGVHSLTGNLGLSGSAGRQRLGGHVLAGFAADALRLEGVAPFGGPVFILAAERGRGTLLLTRDRRVVPSAAPAEILEAIVGVKLAPDDLLAALTGCVRAAPAPVSGSMYGADWLAVDVGGGATAYLRRTNAEWSVVSGTVEGLQIDYGTRVAGLPEQVRIRTADPRRESPVNLLVRLQPSFEINPQIDPAAFSVTVPPGTLPITVQELRESYHR